MHRSQGGLLSCSLVGEGMPAVRVICRADAPGPGAGLDSVTHKITLLWRHVVKLAPSLFEFLESQIRFSDKVNLTLYIHNKLTTASVFLLFSQQASTRVVNFWDIHGGGRTGAVTNVSWAQHDHQHKSVGALNDWTGVNMISPLNMCPRLWFCTADVLDLCSTNLKVFI